MSASVATMRVAPDALKQAVYARRDHFLANVATLTMKQARRLIEADLGLDAKALDEASTKAAVAQYVDLVLAAGDGPSEKPSAASKENRAPAATAKAAKPVLKPAREDADEEEEEDADSDEEEEDADSDEDSDGSDDSDSGAAFDEEEEAREGAEGGVKKQEESQTNEGFLRRAPVAGAVACPARGVQTSGPDLPARVHASQGRRSADRGAEKHPARQRPGCERLREGGGQSARQSRARARPRRHRREQRHRGRPEARAVATDQWGQATKYAEDAGDDDDTSDEEDETSDEEDDASDDDDDAEKASDDDDDAEKADSVEPEDVFFDDDDGDANDAVDDTEAVNELKASKAPRRGGALYSDSDEEEQRERTRGSF